MSQSPFTTAELKRLPRKAYAYSPNCGSTWEIVNPAETVQSVISAGNSETLTVSDYYAEPVDAMVIAEIVTRSFTVAQHISKAYEG